MAATIQPREGGKKHIYIFLYCSSTSHALLSSYQYRHTHRKRRSIYPHLTPLTYMVEIKTKARCGGDRTSALKSPVPRGPSWWVPFLPSSSSFLTSSRPSSLPSILLLPSFLLLLPDLPLPFLFHPSRQSATAADVGAMFPRTSTTMA